MQTKQSEERPVLAALKSMRTFKAKMHTGQSDDRKGFYR